MWCTVTIIQSTVCTHCQKAQAFDSVPGTTAKNPVCFSRTSPCLCVWRRKLPVSLLIRCYKWKTLLFTTVFLETYFNHCREAVKLRVRNHRGKIPSILRCRVCCTMTFRCSNKPQMWKTWPQVKTWGVYVSAHRKHPPSAFTPPKGICHFSWSTSARSQLSILSTSLIPAGGDFQGSTARGWDLYIISTRDMVGAVRTW